MPVATRKYRYQSVTGRKYHKEAAVVKKMTIKEDESPGTDDLAVAVILPHGEPSTPDNANKDGVLRALDNQNDRSGGFPSFGLRLDQSFANSWVMFNRDSGNEMTNGTWIISSDMEIVGGPLPAATGLDLGDVSNPKCSTPKKNVREEVEVWLDSHRQMDYVDDPPSDSEDFQPNFNSTLDMISSEDENDSPAMNVEDDDDNSEIGSSHCLPHSSCNTTHFHDRNEIHVDSRTEEAEAYQPFEVSMLVEKFSHIMNEAQTRNKNQPRLSRKQSPFKISQGKEEDNVSDFKEYDGKNKSDSGIGDSVSICNQNIAEGVVGNTPNCNSFLHYPEDTGLVVNAVGPIAPIVGEHSPNLLPPWKSSRRVEPVGLPNADEDNNIKRLKMSLGLSGSRGSASVVLFPNA